MNEMYACMQNSLSPYVRTLFLFEWNCHSLYKLWVHLTLGFLSQVIDFKINNVIETGHNIKVHTVTF